MQSNPATGIGVGLGDVTEVRVDKDPRDQGPRETNPQTPSFGGTAQRQK